MIKAPRATASVGDVAGARQARNLRLLSDETAGRRRALEDCSRLEAVVSQHKALSGGNAVVAHADAMAQLAEIHGEGRAALASPEMCAGYDIALQPALADARSRVTQHAAAQSVVEHHAVIQGELEHAQRSTANAWNDPARFVVGLELVEKVAKQHLPANSTEALRQVALANALAPPISGAIDNALAADEPEFAQHIFATWGSNLALAERQTVIAQLTEAERNARLSKVLNEVAGEVHVSLYAERGIRLPAVPGTGVHPLARGIVLETDAHGLVIGLPDGSHAAIRGLGLVHVAVGDLVTPLHVVGTAGEAIFLEHTEGYGVSPEGQVGSVFGMVLGTVAEARLWPVETVVARISARSDLSPSDRDLATKLAMKKMLRDRETLTRASFAANRNLAMLLQGDAGRYSQAADLPDAVAGSLLPDQLRQVDEALRTLVTTAFEPPQDSALMLRLEVMRRYSPEALSALPLGQFVGQLNLSDLAKLAVAQASDGAIATGHGNTPRDAVLDQFALRQCITGQVLPDAQLASAFAEAITVIRLSHSDISDTTVISAIVADAIQSKHADD